MKKLLVFALATIGMVACFNEDVVELPKSDTIRFADAYINNSTRADQAVDPSTTKATLEAFDVWAYMSSVDGKVLVDEDVKLVSGGWDYANIQYWTPNKDYFFAALAPMNSANWDLDATQAVFNGGAGLVEFENVDGGEDLLYATAKATTPDMESLQNNGMETVKFQFQHLLSKVKFTFVNGFTNDNATVEVKNIKMSAPKTGSINLGTGYEWVLGTESKVYEYGNAGKIAMGAKAECDNERLTIPAAATYTYAIDFDVTLYYGDEVAYEVHKQSLVTGVALEMGKAYNFVAEITPDHLNLELCPIVFEVVGVDAWDTTPQEVPVDYLYDSTTNTCTVNSAEGLEQFAAEIIAGNVDADANITLAGDIDLNDLTRSRTLVSNWTPVGTKEAPYTGTFDGNGYTIKNLTLVESEAKEGKAYIGFFGYAQDATIKNVTFENVTINIPCLDIDHSQGHIGAVAGSLEGTSRIENVTVKGDIQVYATQDANGASRVAVVAGGNSYGDVTMKNVHVIANDGSSLIANNNTGALAGQLQGKSVFENCSSNIDVTVNKFFAGGIIGLAAGDQLFKNCHTTGDIAVVAGREGKANDQYRVGGIAGGWADGKTKVCTLIDCSYTGQVSGKNADGSVAEPLDYMGYVGRGYTLANCAGSKVVIDGKAFVQAYDNVYGVYYYDGAILDVKGVKAILLETENGFMAVSVEEKNLKGMTATGAATWAEGLGEGWKLASIYDLDAIHAARKALNVALAADNAENALFCETNYYTDGKYALYISSTNAEGNDPQGEAYFSNRVHVKYFNLNGYWDYNYSTFATINKSAPLKDNYFARGVYAL
ncbi:MAG: fimbrillin family protein [Alistipes sp.]|nr:fimbrillin family protein [Alistipes sp.]